MAQSRPIFLLMVILALLVLTACTDVATPVAPQTPAAVDTILPPPTATQTSSDAEDSSAVAILVPTATPLVEPTAESVDWTAVASIEGDYFVRGNPNAPIRLVDYSDFL